MQNSVANSYEGAKQQNTSNGKLILDKSFTGNEPDSSKVERITSISKTEKRNWIRKK